MGIGERELDTLILADGPTEDDALFRVGCGATEGDATSAQGFGGDEDALGVEAIEEVVEAAPNFADNIAGIDGEVVVEDLVRIDGVAPELFDFADRDVLGVEVGEEEGHAVGAAGGISEGRGTREEEDLGGFLGLGCPDLLAADEVVVAIATGEGRDGGCVGASVGFGDAEGDVEAPSGGLGKDALFEFGAAVADNGIEAKDREVEGGGAIHGCAGSGHLFEEDRGFGDAEASATVFGWDGDAEPTGLGEGVVEVPGELVVLVAAAPVGVIEAGSEGACLGADLLLLLGRFEIHWARPPRGDCRGAEADGQHACARRST